jgi:hypothetical protein
MYPLLKIYHVGLQCRCIQVMDTKISIVNLILSLLILSLTSHIFIKCNMKRLLDLKFKKNPTWLFLLLIIIARKKSFKINVKVLSFFKTKLNAQSFTSEVMHKCLQEKNENLFISNWRQVVANNLTKFLQFKNLPILKALWIVCTIPHSSLQIPSNK